jgi:hypothetical protein
MLSTQPLTVVNIRNFLGAKGSRSASKTKNLTGICESVVALPFYLYVWRVGPMQELMNHRNFLNTHATVERVAAPRTASPPLLLRNAEVNTSLRQLVAMQQ